MAYAGQTPFTVPSPARRRWVGFARRGVVAFGRAVWPLLPWALLFLALALALITLDFPTALWTRWLPLPLALGALGAAAVVRGLPAVELRDVAFVTLLIAPAGVRAMLSLTGPLPLEGLREAQEFGVIFVLAAGLWMMARANPTVAARVWVAAIVVGWLASLNTPQELDGLPGRGMEEGPVVIHPWQAATGWSAVLGLIAVTWLAAVRRLGIAGEMLSEIMTFGCRRRVFAGARMGLRLACALIGAWIGFRYLASVRDLPTPVALAIERGAEAEQHLWVQSILVGWGHRAVVRLAEVLAAPHPAIVSPWGGPFGLLAIGGVIGTALLALWIAYLIVRRPNRDPAGRSPLTQLAGAATPIALLVGGLILVGGARSAVVMFLLAGWSALALVDSEERTRRGAASVFGRRLAMGLAACGALAVTVALWMPVRGRSILENAARERLDPAVYRAKLVKARRLNPFDPAIPLAQAHAWREAMNRSPQWSESLYLRVVRSYDTAIRLDPYETLYPIRLALFQLLCKPEDVAIETIHRALNRHPNAMDLVDWLYLTTLRQNRTRLAYGMLEKGLALEPDRKRWWLRRFEWYQTQGQGPLAGQALAVALTAAPDDPNLLSHALKAGRAPRRALPPVPSISTTVKPEGAGPS